MSTQHWKGPTIPTQGDDPILEAFPTLLDTAGLYIPATTQAAARVIATQVLAATPQLITPTRPAVFFINGVFFYADGSRDTDGSVRIRPANAASGILHQAQNTYDGLGAADTTVYTEGEGTITLPVDSIVEFYLEECVSGYQSGKGSLINGFRIDGATVVTMEIDYNEFFATRTARWVQKVSAGSHTVAYTTQKKSGVTPVYHYSAGAWMGRRFTVTSLGIAA